MIDITSMLREKGLKPTPQRLAIYDILMRTKAHPTAEWIYEKVRASHPAMSFNTVYKTLEAFEAAGLIQKFNPGQGLFRYDGNAQPHAHVTCLSCGRVDDIDDIAVEEVSRFRDELASHIPYRVSGRIDVLLYGYCQECQRKGHGGMRETKAEQEGIDR